MTIAKDFLLDAGTNGFLASLFNLMSTELNGLTNGSTATSSVGGSSGVFSQTNFVNSLMTELVFTAGGAFTPTAGGCIAGWWLKSNDGGTTFEKTVSATALPRAVDFIIPFVASAYALNDICFGILAPSPWPSCKVFVQNQAGVTLPATGNLIKAAPVGWGY